ncbi:hypothetical protein V5O48_009016 [Marasmius crinis-equi]|uniref:Uncharacterized protein n=1 Tax=Marasmius crinis-equi TaxID=585013 RepID=A0ABR3FCE1_9AGAR
MRNWLRNRKDQSKDASGNIDSTGFVIDCNSRWASNETLTNWYMMSCTTLDNPNFDQFFEAAMKRFLGELWDYNLANNIGSIPQADSEAFVDFAECVLAENRILEGRGSHLTESMLLQRLWNAIAPVLRTDLDRNDDKAVAIGHLRDKILNGSAKLSEVSVWPKGECLESWTDAVNARNKDCRFCHAELDTYLEPAPELRGTKRSSNLAGLHKTSATSMAIPPWQNSSSHNTSHTSFSSSLRFPNKPSYHLYLLA